MAVITITDPAVARIITAATANELHRHRDTLKALRWRVQYASQQLTLALVSGNEAAREKLNREIDSLTRRIATEEDTVDVLAAATYVFSTCGVDERLTLPSLP